MIFISKFELGNYGSFPNIIILEQGDNSIFEQQCIDEK